jgi:hypothetical protein
MALKQLSAGIMVGVFALTTIGTELVLAAALTKEESNGADTASISRQEARQSGEPSLLADRTIMPSGTKF